MLKNIQRHRKISNSSLPPPKSRSSDLFPTVGVSRAQRVDPKQARHGKTNTNSRARGGERETTRRKKQEKRCSNEGACPTSGVSAQTPTLTAAGRFPWCRLSLRRRRTVIGRKLAITSGPTTTACDPNTFTRTIACRCKGKKATTQPRRGEIDSCPLCAAHVIDIKLVREHHTTARALYIHRSLERKMKQKHAWLIANATNCSGHGTYDHPRHQRLTLRTCTTLPPFPTGRTTPCFGQRDTYPDESTRHRLQGCQTKVVFHLDTVQPWVLLAAAATKGQLSGLPVHKSKHANPW